MAGTKGESDGGTDFFISYTHADTEWAEWIAWVLEEQGFSVKIQAWDFAPGSNFVLEMNRSAARAARTLAVVSPDYPTSQFGAAEWAAALAKDPEGFKHQLVPVRVRECRLEGLLNQIVRIDLVGKEEREAQRALLDGVSGHRAKPAQRPRFPGSRHPQHTANPPAFPGNPNVGTIRPNRFMPTIRQAPSDLDKRRFMQHAFDTIAQYFEQALNDLRVQEGVEIDFQLENKTQFMAEVFVNGKSRRQCQVWLDNDRIAFSDGPFGFGGAKSFNELLSLAPHNLALAGTDENGLG